MAWDGEKAWSQNWPLPSPPRFIALLNYYFLNLPWMALDPGVELSDAGTAKLFDDPTEYKTVKMTFGEGVGDTPDDYYILYIHPETHRLHATEFVVTYESLLPEGVPSSPPTVLIYDKFAEVEGLVVPVHYAVYMKANQALFLTCSVEDFSFRQPFDTSRMEMPDGAVLDTSVP